MSAPRSEPGADPPPGRRGRARDRRGRGVRGPLSGPGPLTPDGTPPPTTRAEDFDDAVASAAARLRRRLAPDLDRVEFGVEEVPLLPDDWGDEVPMGTHTAGDARRPPRVVVYRLPVAARARGRAETAVLVLDVLVDEVADLLGRDPDELDPRGG